METSNAAPFRYFKAWSDEVSCKKVVYKAWNFNPQAGMENHKFLRRLKNTSNALCRWNRTSFRNANLKVKELETEMSKLDQNVFLSFPFLHEYSTRQRYNAITKIMNETTRLIEKS